MAFLENTGLERVWGHIVHRLSLKADKTYVDEAIGNINLDTYEFITVADIDEICQQDVHGDEASY